MAAKTYRFTIVCDDFDQIKRLKTYFEAEQRRTTYKEAAKKLFAGPKVEDPQAKEESGQDPNFLKFKGFGPVKPQQNEESKSNN